MRRKFAFAIPNDEAIDVLVESSPIIEIGAGSGCWARVAQQAGANVVCYDNSKCVEDADWVFYHHWCPVRKGTQVKILAHTDCTLFLCWPPYDSPMAASCLKYYSDTWSAKWTKFIFVGEIEDGCTGDQQFWRMIERDWTEVKRIAIPRWPYIYDALVVYERKKADGRVS